MHFPLIFCLAAWASKCTAKAIEKQGTPSLYLVGDSTMAFHPAKQGIQGCVFGEILFRDMVLTSAFQVGVEIPRFLQNINIVNLAISGSSARSYNSNGNWQWQGESGQDGH